MPQSHPVLGGNAAYRWREFTLHSVTASSVSARDFRSAHSVRTAILLSIAAKCVSAIGSSQPWSLPRRGGGTLGGFECPPPRSFDAGRRSATRKARTACARYPGQRGNLCHDKPDTHPARISVRKPTQEEGHENWWPCVTSVSVAWIADSTTSARLPVPAHLLPMRHQGHGDSNTLLRCRFQASPKAFWFLNANSTRRNAASPRPTDRALSIGWCCGIFSGRVCMSRRTSRAPSAPRARCTSS